MGSKFRVGSDVYDIPEAEVDGFMDHMEKRGRHAEPIEAPDDEGHAAGVYSAPEGIEPVRAQDDHPNPTTPDNDKPDGIRGLMSALGDAFRGQEERASAKDDLRGEGGGAIIGGMVRGATAGAVSPWEKEQDESPGIAGLARAAGAVASPVNLIGGGSGLVGVARDAAAGGAYNAINEASEGRSPTLGGLVGGAGAGLMSTGGRMIGAGLQGLARGADSAADTARLAASGITPDRLKAYAREAGLDTGPARRQLVSEGERLVKPNAVMPRRAEDIERQYRLTANGLNGSIEGAVDDAGAAGAKLPNDVRGTVARNLYQGADDAAASGFNAGEAGPRATVAQNVERGPQSTTPEQVRAQKIGFDQNAYAGTPGSPESMQGIANKAAGDQYRGILNDYVGQGGPDVQSAFQQASQDYGTAATFRDAAAAKAAQQGTTSPGGASGGLLDKAAAFIPGGAYVPDALANVGRGASDALQGAGAGASWIGRNATSEVDAVGALSAAARGPDNQPTDARQMHEDSIGSELPSRFAQFAGTRDGARALRPWQDVFSKELTVDEAAAEYERLMRTDDNFARTVGPMINGSRR